MLETNKNYFSDNREILKSIPDKSINLFLEDMPYNTTQCDWEYEVDLKEYWELRLPKLADNGVFVLTASQPFTTDLIMSNRKMFKYEMIWQKSIPSNFMQVNRMPLKYHENILVFFNNPSTYNKVYIFEREDSGKERYKYKINSDRTQSEQYYIERNKTKYDIEKKNPMSVVKINNETRNNGCIHPTQKPIELFSYFIKAYTNENDIVFDGYSGSGTTAIACIRNNRQYIICENKKEYFDLQTKRIQEEIDKTSLFNSLGGRQL